MLNKDQTTVVVSGIKTQYKEHIKIIIRTCVRMLLTNNWGFFSNTCVQNNIIKNLKKAS